MSDGTTTDAGAHGPSGALATAPRGRFGQGLTAVARWLAALGGVGLVFVTAFVCVSVIGKSAFRAPILGDAEFAEMVCAVSIFAFFPYCQITAGNIVVDFFTVGLSPRRRDAFDGVADLVFAAIWALVTWRMIAGGIEAFERGEVTMMLKLELWWGYLGASIGCVVLVVTCLYTAWLRLRGGAR
ncbi:MAG: TRAP transporter small permease [Rhodospirillales bacterium]